MWRSAIFEGHVQVIDISGSCGGYLRVMWGSPEGHVRSSEGHVGVMWGSPEGQVEVA